MQRAKAVEARGNRAVGEKSRLLRVIETEAPLTLRPLIFHGRRLARLEYVSVVYGGNGVLENLSFEVMQGERLLLRGKNGSGTSSLRRALAGKSGACEGDIFLPGGLGVSYGPQDSSWINGTLKAFSCNRNIRENLLRAVLHRFGFERSQFDTPLEDLSAGQKKKVLLAASLCEEAHLYVWDEPLNYIDVISRMQIEHLILQCRPGMVLVEHDSVFTGKVATSVIDLDEMRAR